MHHVDLDTITLENGAHDNRDDGLCLLEAVAWWAEEAHTDQPVCVSPILGQFGRQLNDVLPAGKRQALKSLIPLLPGTADDGLDEVRGYTALDWLIRTCTPAWLDLAGLTEEARALRDLRRIGDLAAAKEAGPVVRNASEKASAAWYAARDAAWYAARDAAWDAAGAVAGDAAGAVAGVAAGVAAREKLAPTVAQLQDSAIELFHQMISPDVTTR